MHTGVQSEERAAHLLRQGRLVESGSISAANGVFNAENSDALIDGNIDTGGVARGLRSLVVRGDVVGSETQPCRVSFGGDVVILGRVRHAKVSGDNVWVGGDATDCQLSCRNQLQVEGILSSAEVVIGNVSMEQKQLAFLGENINKIKNQISQDRQQLASEERRVEKMIQSTQFDVAFGAGQMIVRSRNRIQVKLSRFYEALKGRSSEEIDKALAEFFNKAVVGHLTLKNRSLIQDNVNRRKVFMGLIRNLHGLFMSTRKQDQLEGTLKGYEKRLSAVTDALGEQLASLVLYAGVRPPLSCLFITPEVTQTDDGTKTVLGRDAHLSVDTRDEKLVMRLKHVASEDEVETFVEEPLNRVVISVQEGQILQRSLDEKTTELV